MKYIHGDYGKGTWTYYGGHDPEDPQHAIGNPPTDLSLHKNSPGLPAHSEQRACSRPRRRSRSRRRRAISRHALATRRADPATRLSPTAAAAIRAAIRLAGGREVCFVVRRSTTTASSRRRASSRAATCAACSRSRASRSAARCWCTIIRRDCSNRRGPDLEVAARMHDDGIGFAIIDNDASRAVRRRRGAARTPSCTPLDAATSVNDDLGPGGADRRRAAALRGPAEPARDGRRDRASCTTTAASASSRRAPASANRSAISCRRCGGRRRTASARSCRRTRSTCRSSWSARICRFSRARSPTSRCASRCSRAGATISVCVRLEQARASGQRAVRRGTAARSSRRIRAWAERTRDGSLSDLTIAAAPGGVGRGRRRAGSLPARAMSGLREVLLVQGAPRGGAGRRDRRESSSAVVGPRGAPRVGQLGRGRGAAGVHAPRHRRRASSRGRGREHLGATVSRRSLQRLFGRLDRRGKGLLAALMARLARSNDLLSTASLDLVLTRLAPALESARDKSGTAVRSARDVSRSRAASRCCA